MSLIPPAPPTNPEGKPTVADLEMQIKKFQSDICTMAFYLNKVRADKIRLDQMLVYYNDNSRYLKKHEGTINIEYFKKLQENIRKCSFFLKNASNDIAQFEKNMATANKKLDSLKEEMENKIEAETCRVLEFRRKI